MYKLILLGESMMELTAFEEFKASLAEKDLDGIDSEYTYSTLTLVEKFNASGAHLNKWWVMTPTDWFCPCCKRTKAEIVRLNKNEYLTCQLHEHHDHMKDVVKTLFEKYSTQRDQIVADELSEKFAIKAAFSLSAYDNTIICYDCNKADADAKKIVKAHKFFSFSPCEIAEFVKSSSNQEHVIDPLLAQQVWERAKLVFEIRMEFAERFAKIAAENKDWYQPSERTARQIERLAQLNFERNGLHQFDRFEPEKLLYNTVPFKGVNSSWRLKENPIIKKRPSANELAHLIATRGKYWTRYEDNWSCPCCLRNKYDCVRPSKKNSWIFEVKTASLFSIKEMNFDSNPAPMCVDCVDMALNFGREVLELSGKRSMIDFPSSVISFGELRKVVIARPHSQHNVKNEVINHIIPPIVERVIEFCDGLS